MKNMINLHRGLSKSLKLNLVDYYLLNYKKKYKSKHPYLLLSRKKDFGGAVEDRTPVQKQVYYGFYMFRKVV